MRRIRSRRSAGDVLWLLALVAPRKYPLRERADIHAGRRGCLGLTLNSPKPGGKALIVFPATMLWCRPNCGPGHGQVLRRIETPASHHHATACVRHAMEE